MILSVNLPRSSSSSRTCALLSFPGSHQRSAGLTGTTRFIDAAARRQKWIDQSQSVNLFLATPDMKTLSHMDRRAWDKGLKTTYYLRTLQASNIEKATIDVKKEVRGGMAAGPVKREFTAEEKNACSIDAMMNGGECEACQ
jgi:ribonucleoside-diphosphate reductase alpha chain